MANEQITSFTNQTIMRTIDYFEYLIFSNDRVENFDESIFWNVRNAKLASEFRKLYWIADDVLILKN